jgi:hypothetical protein
MEWYRWYFNITHFPFLLIIVVVPTASACIYHLRKTAKRIQSVRLGRDDDEYSVNSLMRCVINLLQYSMILLVTILI